MPDENKARLSPGQIQDILWVDMRDSHPNPSMKAEDITRDHYKCLAGIQQEGEQGADFWIMVEVGSCRQWGVYTNDNDLTSIFELKEGWSNKKARELIENIS